MHTDDRGINDRELVVEVGGEGVKDLRPHAAFGPTQESRVHRLPFRIPLREIAPRGAAPQHPKDCVEHLPVRPRSTASSAMIRRQQILDPLPLLLSQLVAMRYHRGA